MMLILAIPFVLACAGASALHAYPAPLPTDTQRVSHLPVVETPARTPGGRTLAVLLSGDGDWATFARSVANSLADQGISVVGLKSRSYLATKRTPDETARDVDALMRTYLTRWQRDTIVLIGYSRGADFAPFIVNRIEPDLRERIRLVTLISPGERASFEFHMSDLIKDTKRSTDVLTLPEAEQMRGLPILCIYGSMDKSSLCPIAPEGLMQVILRDGGHRMSDYELATSLILAALRNGTSPF